MNILKNRRNMKNLKKLGTWIFWCLLNPFWEYAVKYRKDNKVPNLSEIHEHFRNLLSALCILGWLSRDFDSQVRDRLRLIIYWAALSMNLELDVNKSAQDIMWEINANTPNTPDQFKIRWNSTNAFLYEYSTDTIDWSVPKFLDGTVWSKDIYMSEENTKLAYLANILLNRKEVK